ncbi:MAG: hypothetical protein R6T99_06455 [Bacteroidales bacterium]
MFLPEVIFSIIAALLVGVLFYYIFRYSGPWGSFWTFLLVLVLAGLAAAAWIEPIGPAAWNVAWLPILFVILLFALFLAAATTPDDRRRIRTRRPVDTETPGEEAAAVTLGIFFWIFIVFLVFAAIWGIFK